MDQSAPPPRSGGPPWRNWGDHPILAVVTAVASLLAITTFLIDRFTGDDKGCVAAVGRWDWLSTGGIVAIGEDRLIHWYRTAADPLPTINGVWECDDDAPRRYTFRWTETKFVDTLSLSTDGERMIGANTSTGFKLSGTRAR